MHELQRQPHSQQPYQDPNAGAGAFLALAAVVGSIIAFVSLFSYAIIAGIVALIYIATATTIGARLHIKFPDQLKLPKGLLALSIFCAIWAGVVVFQLQWLTFDVAAWIVTGLYVAGLVLGALTALEMIWRVIATLLATAMVVAIVVLPVPAGGEDASKESNRWSVAVVVTDSEDQPLSGALAHCAVLMAWEPELAIDVTTARTTNEAGKAEPWRFTEDRRLKVVICNALKQENEGNAGYPLKSAVLVSPRQGDNELRIALTERPHPDVAYLLVKASEPSVNWYYLDFELWAGAPGNIPFGSNSGTLRPITKKSWRELRGVGFAIRGGQPTRDLHLRLRYEGPSSDGLTPPKVEVATYRIGDIVLGGRRSVTVPIPWEYRSR
jgi:hypothetical protein